MSVRRPGESGALTDSGELIAPTPATVAPATVQLQWGVKIPLRDGVELNATLYRPRSQPRPAPVVFTLTPYIGQTYHERGMYFAAHGYPFLTVDVRGRGNSDGVFQPFLQEAEDGYDVVEWLAQQPYGNGQVAMWGGSYGGYDQWVTAAACPPHLATIVPAAAPYLGVDFPMRSSIGYPYVMRWLTLVAGRTAQEKIFWHDEPFWSATFRQWFEAGAPFQALDTLLGHPSPTFQEWLAHPHLDAYWDRYNPTAAEYAELTLPILTITGIYDSDQPGALRHYREHLRHASPAARARHYLVIGPWDHAGTRTPAAEFGGLRFGPASLVDLGQLHVEWYAWTMQGGPKPAFLQQPVAYYVSGAERWRYAATLEAVTAEHVPFYLDSTGTASQLFAAGVLGHAPGRGPADVYVYDPRDTGRAALEAGAPDPLSLRPTFPTENLTDQTLVYAEEGRQLIYHSAPFARDTEVSGFFRLSAWLAIDQPDTDFRVAVYALDEAGGSILLTTDQLRARYRESPRAPQLIGTTEPLRYDFEGFTFVSRLLRRGHRLRLVLGPINSIHSQKNYNSGGIVAEESMSDARPVTVQLFHDAAHPSVLYVPLGVQ